MEFVGGQSEEHSSNEPENIWTATADGDHARVQQLIASGVSPNAADETGYTPMSVPVTSVRR
jgi:hypothetical protein